jgi:hypothetical protein
MPHFGTNGNHKCVNMQTIYYASIAKPNLNSFEYVTKLDFSMFLVFFLEKLSESLHFYMVY